LLSNGSYYSAFQVNMVREDTNHGMGIRQNIELYSIFL
jgi:hypothetical protein